jgi:hypothetical protein
MHKEHNSVLANYVDRDQYTACHLREQALNAAILRADISENFEQYLELFDAFYVDDLEVSSETQEQPIQGKVRVRPLLADFLIPLHIMAEIGGLLVSVQESPVPGDLSDETHSLWTLELLGLPGRTCTLGWRVARKWKGPILTLTESVF